MLKSLLLTVLTLSVGIPAAIACGGDDEARWEYQGTASTGERVTLNLDSIRPGQRSGKFFTYQIGRDQPSAYTTCNGKFQVAKADGVTFEPLMAPQSAATRKMLDRVCANPS
jgi:hypothetical protein